VVADGTVTRRTIQVGIESSDFVEVVGGLAGDEAVVVTGQSSLRDGSKVLASSEAGPSYAG
jgi:membrane fusion protein (multidrug efflux system)